MEPQVTSFISDSSVATIVAAFFSFLTTVLTAVVTYYMAKLNNKAEIAAVKTTESAEALQEGSRVMVQKLKAIEYTTEKTNQTGEKTHKLSNSAMEEQLKLYADLLRERADDRRERAEQTKVAADIRAAEEAEKKATAAEEKHRKHAEAGVVANAENPAPPALATAATAIPLPEGAVIPPVSIDPPLVKVKIVEMPKA